MKCQCGYKFEKKEKHQTPDIVCPKCGIPHTTQAKT